jgi:hypothetical protein
MDSADAAGIPTKQIFSRWVGRNLIDRKNHEERVRVIQAAMTHPTIIDAHMKEILGTFDTYLNFEKNTLDAVMRQGGFGSPVYSNLKLPMDYGATDFQWVTNARGSDIYAVDKSVAVAQRLSYMTNEPAYRAYLKELSLYSSVQQEGLFGEFATAMNLYVRPDESPAAAVLLGMLTPAVPSALRFAGPCGTTPPPPLPVTVYAGLLGSRRL